MITDSEVVDTASDRDRPRAFSPEYADRLNLPQTRPGWDLGPERRVDDGRTLARMLTIAGIGLLVLAIGGALLRARGSNR